MTFKRLVQPLASTGLVLMALTAATPAAAATEKPFVLDASDQAEDPAVAVDSQGTAHIVWNQSGAVVQPDLVHYCQVPRGQRACTTHLTMAAPETDFAGPRVLLPPDGRVLVLTSRCCSVEPGSPIYMFSSSDGGASFTAPVKIGNNELSGDARLGPGPFSISSITDVTTGGVLYQAAPLAPPPVEERPNLGANPSGGYAAYSGSIGFLDPLTPLVAMDDLHHVFFRRFGGGTAYNDAAAWGPLTDLGPGDEPKLASLLSGKKGVHLLMRVGQPGKRRYVARRYDGTGFGPGVTVSEIGDPIFRDFFMDPSGRLHAVWIDNELDSLRHRVSNDGKTWKPIEELTGKNTADDFYNILADAAKDGGGFAVFDANGRGPVRAIPFGPKGPVGSGGEGECADSLEVGGATVVAQEGCLQRNGDVYTTSGDLRVNGIDLILGGAGGSGAVASAAPRITIDKGARTLETSAKVEARVGNVVLGRQQLQWRLPLGKGQITDPAGNPAEFDTGQFGIDFLGLRVMGYTVPKLTGSERVEIPVNLRLPAPFDSVLGDQATGQAKLRSTNGGGLELNEVKVRIADVSLGIAEIKTFNVDYLDDPFLLQGSTAILLPVVQSELGIDFGLRNGDFDYGRFTYEFPPGQLLVATDVFMREVGFAVQKASSCDKPTQIAGSVGFRTGPEVEGIALIGVKGTVSYAFPLSSCGLPGVLDVQGTGEFIGIPVAKLRFTYRTDGQFTFATGVNIDLSAASLSVGLEGGVDIPSASFYAGGEADLKLLGYSAFGADFIASTDGMATCATVLSLFLVDIDIGFEHRWSQSLSFDDFQFPDCEVNIDDYKPAAFKGGGARASSGANFTLERGLPSATVRLSGAGAAPGFTLKGPGGIKVSYAGSPTGPPAQGPSGKRFAVLTNGNQTFVKLARPAAGTYTVTDPSGAIGHVEVARGLPEPKVSGRLARGRGQLRTLTYKARKIPGQKLIFVEQGKGVRTILAESKKARGALHFRPASGPRGKRTVFAIVEQDRMPRARIAVAHFTAPGPIRPGRPRDVRLRRRGAKLVVSWKGAPGAARYAVSWALRDGRRQGVVTKGRRLVIPGVPGIDAGRIVVAGLRPDNVAGPVAKARLKQQPKRVKKHHRRAGKHAR